MLDQLESDSIKEYTNPLQLSMINLVFPYFLQFLCYLQYFSKVITHHTLRAAIRKLRDMYSYLSTCGTAQWRWILPSQTQLTGLLCLHFWNIAQFFFFVFSMFRLFWEDPFDDKKINQRQNKQFKGRDAKMFHYSEHKPAD